MDLVADMLWSHLHQHAGPSLRVELMRPTLRDRGAGIGRFVNRYWDYARWLRPRVGAFDVFHVVDHSYAHLVHVLPAARTVVTCHDVDAFMPLVDPTAIRTRLPNAVTRRVLSGLQRAAVVTCDSVATLDEARRFNLLEPARSTVVPMGVHPSISPNPDTVADGAVATLIGAVIPGALDLLHVGSCIPRKRVDLLLRVFRGVLDISPGARLLKAGGSLTRDQQSLARELGVDEHIVTLPFLDTATLAALYRRASVVLVTSSREGFGLPVVEALAAGAAVVATDLPVLREVGGTAVTYAPLDDVPRWVETIRSVVAGREVAADRSRAQRAGFDVASRFTWRACASELSTIYTRLHEALAS